MSHDYSNHSQFGIETDRERYCWVTWTIFVATSSLIGDTIILVSSLKYGAFQLHGLIVLFIQHIAVCDLLNSAVSILPSIVSMATNSGGDDENVVLSNVMFFVTYYVNTVSAYLICAMILGKLLLLRYPLRSFSWFRRCGQMVCSAIWISSIFLPLAHQLIDWHDVVFDYRVHAYTYSYSSSIWEVLLPVLSIVVVFTPGFVTLISTIALLKEANKIAGERQENLRWQGLITVVLSATVCVLSTLPITVYLMMEPFMKRDNPLSNSFFVVYYRVACSFLNFNTLGNFFVYSLTVQSFRSFLKTRVRLFVSLLKPSSSHQRQASFRGLVQTFTVLTMNCIFWI